MVLSRNGGIHRNSCSRGYAPTGSKGSGCRRETTAKGRDDQHAGAADNAKKRVPGTNGGEPEAGVDLHRLGIQTFTEADIDIVIDGKIDEALWQKLPHYDNMLVSIPALVTPAEYATQMRIFATEKSLCQLNMEQPRSQVKRYSRRDDFINRDTFGVTIDASGESLVAYWFHALGDSLSDGKYYLNVDSSVIGMVLG